MRKQYRGDVRRNISWGVLIASAAILVPQTIPVAAAQAAADSGADSDSQLQEVVVSANRRTESIQKVAISVEAFSQEQMDAQGVKSVDDLTRLTPGLSLTRNASTGANQISIRGISSSAGSGTTGLYIDDTPIQIRNLGYGSGNSFPGLFDLERVEVLRGPQGTLFGAGSEGGTVRFLQTGPSLSDWTTYDRAEVSHTENGAPSYEIGSAVGGPIVDGRIGFRASVYYRKDGGFIDAVNGTSTVLDPTGSLYGKSVDFTPTSTYQNNINWSTTLSGRVALKFAVTDELEITPSVTFQRRHDNDGQGNNYVLSESNANDEQYARPFYVAGNPATDSAIAPMTVPNNQQGDDTFTLSQVHLNWALGAVQLVSNSSFFSRASTQWYDYTRGYIDQYSYDQSPTYPEAGWKAMADYINSQHNFVQELRLQSSDPTSRFNWVAGLFYNHNEQEAGEPISVNWLANATEICFYCAPSTQAAGWLNAVSGGTPYGPGSSAYENFTGVPLDPNQVTFNEHFGTVDKQIAAFTQGDFDITKSLKLTVGLRFSHTSLDYSASYWAGDNNANAPAFQGCTVAPICPTATQGVGQGVYAPVYPSSASSTSSNSLTPKVGLSWQINDNNLLYATAAKGFRPAGANLQVPSVCDFDLAEFGYTSNGKSTEPDTYRPDSVWSYEVGSKNTLADGRLVLDSSVYLIKWKNIQTDVFLPDCAYDFVDNLADATAKGFDMAVQARPFHSLTTYASVGYTDATFNSNAVSPGGVVIFPGGSAIPGAGAPWTISVGGEYDFKLLAKDFYARADWTHTTQVRRVGSELPGTPSYDPLMIPDQAYSLTDIRIGWRLDAMDLSLFVNNLLDAHPLLGMGHNTFQDQQEWTAVALRPRTIGLTLTYRR